MLVLIPLGATIATLVRLSRSYAGESLMSFSTLLQATGDLRTPVTDFLHELGSSVITVVYTLDLVPSERAYGWGTATSTPCSVPCPTSFGTCIPRSHTVFWGNG